MFKQKTAYEMRISDWSSDVCSSDVIFIDIMMPRLDGYQACALIKNNPAFRNTPVIMLSSKDGLFDRARGRIVGSDEYLTKPRSEEHTSELQSLMRISYAVFCLKKKNKN